MTCLSVQASKFAERPGPIASTAKGVHGARFLSQAKWLTAIVVSGRNVLILARALGLFRDDPKAASAFRETSAMASGQGPAKIKRFESWRDAKIREVSDRYRLLSRAAIRATDTLINSPDSDEAWDALAAFYHAEAELSAAFDWLMFHKASAWLRN